MRSGIKPDCIGGIVLLQDKRQALIKQEAYDPCGCKLKEYEQRRGPFAACFPVNGGDCCCAGDIKQTENHHKNKTRDKQIQRLFAFSGLWF